MAKRNVKVQYDTGTCQLDFKASNGDRFDGINNAIEAACGADKSIGQAITSAVTAALTAVLGEGGAITLAISTGVTAAITAALGEGGAIKTAVDAAIAVHAGG